MHDARDYSRLVYCRRSDEGSPRWHQREFWSMLGWDNERGAASQLKQVVTCFTCAASRLVFKGTRQRCRRRRARWRACASGTAGAGSTTTMATPAGSSVVRRGGRPPRPLTMQRSAVPASSRRRRRRAPCRLPWWRRRWLRSSRRTSTRCCSACPSRPPRPDPPAAPFTVSALGWQNVDLHNRTHDAVQSGRKENAKAFEGTGQLMVAGIKAIFTHIDPKPGLGDPVPLSTKEQPPLSPPRPRPRPAPPPAPACCGLRLQRPLQLMLIPLSTPRTPTPYMLPQRVARSLRPGQTAPARPLYTSVPRRHRHRREPRQRPCPST